MRMRNYTRSLTAPYSMGDFFEKTLNSDPPENFNYEIVATAAEAALALKRTQFSPQEIKLVLNKLKNGNAAGTCGVNSATRNYGSCNDTVATDAI